MASPRNPAADWLDTLLPWRVFAGSGRSLLWQFTIREVTSRYKGAFLGVLWSFLTPLMMLAVYTVVFGFIFGGRFGESESETRIDFALALFCGLNLFNLFAESVSRAPGVILTNPNFVTKVVFPLEILPISLVGGALVHFLVATIPLLLGVLITHALIPLTALFLIPLLVPLIFFCLGLCFFGASLGVFVRDISSLIGPMVTIVMFLSAVFYSVKNVPEPFRSIIQLNPLASLIDQARNAVIWGHGLEWGHYFAILGLSLVVLAAGHAMFVKTKGAFADVL